MDLQSLALEAVPKALVYASAMLVVGTCVAHELFRLRVADGLTGDRRDTFNAALVGVARSAARLLVVALLVRAWAHTAVVFGLTESLQWENLRTAAWESQWGERWQLQVAGAVALAIVTQLISDATSVVWKLTALVAAAICYLLPLLGHAAGEPARVLLHGSHLLGAGIWVGTIGAVVLASRARHATTGSRTKPPEAQQSLLRQFSPVALTGAALLVVTGLTAAWWYVGSIDALATSAYGRLLLLKVFLVADVATCGFLNWQRLRRPAAEAAGGDLFVTLEVALAVAVVIVTAVLTEVEHP